MSAMHRPRLLPATIVAMALLLLLKSVSLVWAATGGSAPGPASGTAGGSGGGSAGAAVGAGNGAPPGAAGAAAVPATAAGPAMRAAMAPEPAAPVSEAERALLLDLRHRRDALDARGRALDERSAMLAAAESRLSARVDQLGALQTKLEQLESDRQAHDDANWSGLVHVYETMKPREAAQIFDALDMQVLLAVLDRMQPRRAAPVLAAMQPDRARLATQMLAEMRTRAITPSGVRPAANGADAAVPPKG
jgi:flagellar motility protein MotE (MotC chaperone)